MYIEAVERLAGASRSAANRDMGDSEGVSDDPSIVPRFNRPESYGFTK